ncbi:Gfo/Idh/MocA family protein [Mycetocola tolaasinivorans]|uniref:Gfo/Idh/MocA family protein n=1 Tax=Mycetocola tolaasinivorans TaxID=76635 RepID=UPI001FE84FB8|nr:Gfo/Idh/MocA family oxidoreductase [Mycetocola tolaasinivorans]
MQDQLTPSHHSDAPARAPWGVGILGAGPVTQAIHLPTLSRLQEHFTVRAIMDVDPAVAVSVAARVGARVAPTMADLLEDPAVEVVVICSPHRFHAEQVIAACRAGKRAILCEKPFAMTPEEAREIAEVSAETGVPILVGAMHTYDPAWLAARAAWGEFPAGVHTVRSSIVLPPNAYFEDSATEVLGRPASVPADFTDPEQVAERVLGGVMGLAIHDLPLVRTFVPEGTELEVVRAAALAPGGYHILLRAGALDIELHAALTDNWEPSWFFEAIGEDSSIAVDFGPSYIHAGSAVVTLAERGRRTIFGRDIHNGYAGEWLHLAEVAAGATPTQPAETLIEDLRFALNIAETASRLARNTVKAAHA